MTPVSQDLHHGRTTDAEKPSDAKIFSSGHRELPLNAKVVDTDTT